MHLAHRRLDAKCRWCLKSPTWAAISAFWKSLSSLNWHKIAHSPSCQKPSPNGWLDRWVQFRHRLRMRLDDAIATLARVLACLVVAFSIALFPPSATHAGQGMDRGAVAHSGDMKAATGHHGEAGNETAKSGSLKKCGSPTSADHPEFGPNQCCSGICLTAVLIEGPIVRIGRVSASEFIVGFKQMTHIDLNGFLRPPRLLI